MENSTTEQKYLKMKGRAGFHFGTHAVMLVGACGAVIFMLGVLQTIVGVSEGLSSMLAGAFLSLLLLPGLFRSGMELDQENKRFREFDGFLGRNKDEWIDVGSEDYLSIVGFTQTQSGSGRRPSATVTMGMSKVYFWSGDWHLELFKGDYDQALKFAEKFAGIYQLAINDVNKDQDLAGPSQGDMNHSF